MARVDIFEQAAERIIRVQENIIGPLALEQAKRVSGLKVDAKSRQVSFSGNKTDVLEKLVEQYRRLFGQTSVEVCKEATHSILSKLPPQEVPSLLK